MSLSVLRRTSLALARPLRSNGAISPVLTFKRMGGHHHFEMKPSSFVWDKLKDIWHLYVFGTCTFYGAIVLYCNVFIGPAQLAEIPEGYKPKHWEYYSHPISRFMQKYFYIDEQESYEKMLNVLYDEFLRMKLKELDLKVKELIKERKDYQAYYFRAVPADHTEYDEFMEGVMDRYASEVDSTF
ncbi:NADH dehydrogenase [ubiquinone] 1 beta subcomplex subunit 5, mitochondrial [Planococcus citri]|uniref:NADH dehydrogenase [ubiquinone] 1 beta subcomplex subunit 5, mitochondrial n=1 Tax=Planococcus citri TaxID=170843 RepID=UPI0031F7BC08